jgi:hypothetical protein
MVIAIIGAVVVLVVYHPIRRVVAQERSALLKYVVCVAVKKIEWSLGPRRSRDR